MILLMVSKKTFKDDQLAQLKQKIYDCSLFLSLVFRFTLAFSVAVVRQPKENKEQHMTRF